MLLGPALAGLIMTGLVGGRAGLRDLLSRSLKWRVDARWYAAALLLIPLLAAIVSFGPSLLWPAFRPRVVTAPDKLGLVLTGITVGLMVGIFEELGWSGFAVPRLLRRYSVPTTALRVGLVWGLWHFIVFWEPDSFAAPAAFALLLVRLFSWLPAMRLLLVWAYDRTGSVLLTMLMHAGLVAAYSFIFRGDATGASLTAVIAAWAGLLWVTVGVVALAGGLREHARGKAVPASSLRPAA